jgi:hypothetical protein
MGSLTLVELRSMQIFPLFLILLNLVCSVVILAYAKQLTPAKFG